MPDRDWPPDDLPAHINSIRKLIAIDRNLYAQWRKYLAAWPGLTATVGEMLKARARYYRGEIIRAKQDTRRYALGDEPKKPSKYADMIIGWVDTYLDELPERIEAGDSDLIDSTESSMKKITDDLERITYGG